ncbi:MAG: DMT family transporter [Gammaproteobacteria bacterium]|nr:DMT family transporter [Gammaproteobacteria bacterium]MCW9004600.1 DMT family transporter [Gammaproteobacteria bacterium]
MERNKAITILSVYCLVILIWSTTPLGIKWSGETVGFLFGITARMLIGAGLSLLLVLIIYKRLCLHASAIHAYIAAAMAIFGAMMPVYWGAQFIDSGLISIVFGMTPIITALLASRYLYEQSLTPFKLLGALLGMCGLVIIFFNQASLGGNAVLGVSAVFLSVVLHSVSSVWIKYLQPDVPALMIATGGLLLSLPMFLLVYFISAETLPVTIPMRSLWSIVYLGVMGSVVGFVGYYYVLVNLPTSTVALITLMTPIIALWIGTLFNFEVISFSVWLGTGFVLSGLIMHQWGGYLLRLIWRV